MGWTSAFRTSRLARLAWFVVMVQAGCLGGCVPPISRVRDPRLEHPLPSGKMPRLCIRFNPCGEETESMCVFAQHMRKSPGSRPFLLLTGKHRGQRVADSVYQPPGYLPYRVEQLVPANGDAHFGAYCKRLMPLAWITKPTFSCWRRGDRCVRGKIRTDFSRPMSLHELQ